MPVAPKIRGPRGAPEGPGWSPGGAPEGPGEALRAPEGPRRCPGGALRAPEGSRRGSGGALRFLGTSKSDSVDFDGFSFSFTDFGGFRYVEVGSPPKEPDFDLFASVGRRGGDTTFLVDWIMP